MKPSLLLCALFLIVTWINPVSAFGQDTRESVYPVNDNPADTTLTENATSEEIRTGYSAINPRHSSSVISIVYGKKLNVLPAQNFTVKLQGLVSGITVNSNGQADNIASIMVRGPRSFSGNGPLVIVDGIPVQDLSAINPYDIESVVILKDAGAQAIYGARALNGIIEITTKTGNRGLHVSYDVLTGVHLPGKGPSDNLLNTEEYADLQWLVYKNEGYGEYHPIYGPSSESAPALPDWAANTDWYAEITRDAPLNIHQLSLSGGNEHSKFYGSFGYHNETGILLHTYSKKYNLRFNSEWKFLNDRLTLGENFSIGYHRINGFVINDEDNPFLMGPYRSQSIIPVYMDQTVIGLSHRFEEGDFGGTGISPRLGNSSNVVADLIRNKDNYENFMNFFGSAYINIRLFDGLNFTSKFGGTYLTAYNIEYTHATYERAENRTESFLREGSGFNRDRSWTHTLRYQKALGVHHINVVGGQESIKYGSGRNMFGMRAGYFSDNLSFRTLSNGARLIEASSFQYEGMLLKSLFMNANYSLMDKYLLSLSVRRDKGANFYSPVTEEYYSAISAGWKLGNEAFMKNMKWIDDFTIRGSFGKTGNFNANWEYAETINLGIDGEFFSNHIDLVFDWYSAKSRDLLMAFEIPATAGEYRIVYMNSGSMVNRGFDFQIGYNNQWEEFGFYSSLAFTSYKNKISNIGDNIQFFDTGGSRVGATSRNMVGQTLSAYFGYKVAGLFQDGTEVTNSPSQMGSEPGFFRYENINDSDNEINPDDRTFIGSPHPDFTVGLNLSFKWRNIDLNGLLYMSQGNQILNMTKWWTDFWPSFQGQKSKRLLYESWTEDNKNTLVPKASYSSNFSTNTQICSYYVEDGSYIRLKSLQLGYSVSKDLLSKVRISSFRIYLQAVNLFTITKYSGLDPEISNPSGIDIGSYPNLRQVLVGLQINI